MNRMLKAAFVTGGHSFEVQALHHMLHKLQGIQFYTQHMDDFLKDRGSRDYDVIVFYNMGKETPHSDELLERSIQPIIEDCAEKGIGFVVLHHALLSYPGWDLWDEVVGIGDRTLHSYRHDEHISVGVRDPSHPITQGLAPWDIVDEIYVMADPGPKSHILLTNENHSDGMKAIAWTGQYRHSKVFCFQCGHDHQAYDDEGFQRVLKQGILWTVEG
jgi:uncharacterized protein